MTHYIIINGPPKSGRSTLARLIQKRLIGSHQAEFHSPLKHFFCAALAAKWTTLASDRPRGVLNGRSAVDALRQLRVHLRALYGPDVLGKWLQFRVLGMNPIPKIVIVDDAVFPEDVEVLRLSGDPISLVRMIRGQEDKDFTPISKPDYTVINANDIRYLGIQADRITGHINKEVLANARS